MKAASPVETNAKTALSIGRLRKLADSGCIKMLSKQEIRIIWLHEFKLGHNAAKTTRNVISAWGKGTTSELTTRRLFENFLPAIPALEMKRAVDSYPKVGQPASRLYGADFSVKGGHLNKRVTHQRPRFSLQVGVARAGCRLCVWSGTFRKSDIHDTKYTSDDAMLPVDVSHRGRIVVWLVDYSLLDEINVPLPIYEKFYCMSFVPIRNTLLYILGKLDQVGHKSAGEFDLPRNMSLLAKVDYLPVEFFASSAYCFPFEGLFDFRSYSFYIAVVVHYAVLLRVNLNVFVAAVQYDVALLRWPQQ
ncbi:hypothetical protein LAZ67_10002261 [Cordylochernes scorpioides]|uniref:Mos1 transposase HTH domain-containing protein n=1 Tax=Cordylochernes scorpioides TaxID=51811 RepID=A0ABY6KX79_9ARAC|nr:hypothetical protein LAZ67_10002261 [Cordylochernes scorpioides]